MTSAPDNPASLVFALRSTWALLLGFGILMLGDGLQSTLLAVRADQEGFTATTTGLITVLVSFDPPRVLFLMALDQRNPWQGIVFIYAGHLYQRRYWTTRSTLPTPETICFSF